MAEELGFDLFVPGQYLKQALAVSLLSVWVLVGLFFYLNHYTKRRYFTIWAAGWLFYALWLTLNFSLDYQAVYPWLETFKQSCISTVALFLFWGSARFLGQRVGQASFGLFMAFLYVWSFYGAHYLDDPLQMRLPIFGLIALASGRVAWCFFVYRRNRRFIGAGLLAVGFLLWGLFHAGHPFLYRVPELFGAGFFAATVLQLFIAVSMIVLVLEEARKTHAMAFENLRSQADAKSVWQSRAAASEERYHSLFHHAGEAIVIVKAADLEVLEINQAAARLLRADDNSGRALNFRMFCQPAPGGGPAPAGGAEFAAWARQQRPLFVRFGNGNVAPVEIQILETHCGGGPALMLFLHELTERAQLEQQLRQAEKLAALGQMISGVAHELNNPLAVVKGYLEVVLGHHSLSPETRASLEKVAQESNRAARLVQNFLAFAREHPPQREKVSLNEIIQRVVDLRKYAVRVAGVEVEMDLDPALPPVLADADQVQQVMVILVNNAIQAMAGRGVMGRLSIATQAAGRGVRVAVRDNGPGVPPQLEAKIFEPFFTTKEVGAGTGLGLSIAHSIMTEHQGAIRLEHPPDGGACFVLEFPLLEGTPATAKTAEESQPSAPVVERGPVAGAQSRAPQRVLVVDDEKVIADMLGEMLGLLGYEPVCCSSSPKALSLIKQERFDAVISDMRMPTMDGRQFFLAVKEHSPALARRIIFLTGDTVNEETRTFLESTGNLYLAKPFQLSGLKKAIEMLGESRTPLASP